MSRLIFLFFAVFFLIPKTHAQQSRRGNVWYFGYNAGIDFNSGGPEGLADGQSFQREGCSAMCDEKGKLVLYTNGIQIWNGKHQVISGDTELGGNDTSTQSAIIVPKPGDANIYYVFTTYRQLICITVDLTLNKGKGGIKSKEVILENSTEKLAAVKHCNGSDYWITAHENGNNTFRSYLLTQEGINHTAVISKIGTAFDFFKPVGNMKFSQQRNKLATAIFGKSRFEIFDFDNSSGKISNVKSIVDQAFHWAYGLEFSPNGKFLYVGETINVNGQIFQLDISTDNAEKILESKTEIGKTVDSFYGSLQLGPDEKIYIAKENSRYLAVINEPDLKGAKCIFDNKGFELTSGRSGMGLPNVAESYQTAMPSITISEKRECAKSTLTANVINSAVIRFQWYKGEEEIAGADRATYIPTSSGNYSVSFSSKCQNVPLFSEPVSVTVLRAELEWSLVECGTVKLSVHADTKIKWSGKGITRSNEKQEEIVLNGFGKESYRVKVYDETAPDCYLEKKLDVDFGICDPTVLIPDIFTPNQDGINEKFEIDIVGGESLQLIIYNRWGTGIYSSTAAKPEWDGNVQGDKAPVGTYTFTLRYKNFKGQEFSRRGTLLLQR